MPLRGFRLLFVLFLASLVVDAVIIYGWIAARETPAPLSSVEPDRRAYLPSISRPSSNPPALPGPADAIPTPQSAQSVVRNAPYVPPGPLDVNGVPPGEILVLPQADKPALRQVFARGQAQGNDPNAFSVLGDSSSEPPHFLTRFDTGPYNLGDYAYLEETIAHFAGSFDRQGAAVRRGLHSWSVFTPMWSDPDLCGAGENVLDCEFRLHHPSLLIVRLGSNDAGRADLFERNLRQVVEASLGRGVIPVLCTKADRIEGPQDTNNRALRNLAAEYRVPLWDFDRLAGTLPDRGLNTDGVHLTLYTTHDYTQPEAFQRGYALLNLSALIVLDILWREIMY
jgi:hypothetical protein